MIQKEFHIWTCNQYLSTDYGSNVCTDAEQTRKCIIAGDLRIDTTQIHFASTKLFQHNYKVFLHLNGGVCYEICLGECMGTSRNLLPIHNLSKLIINGEWGSVGGAHDIE